VVRCAHHRPCHDVYNFAVQIAVRDALQGNVWQSLQDAGCMCASNASRVRLWANTRNFAPLLEPINSLRLSHCCQRFCCVSSSAFRCCWQRFSYHLPEAAELALLSVSSGFAFAAAIQPLFDGSFLGYLNARLSCWRHSSAFTLNQCHRLLQRPLQNLHPGFLFGQPGFVLFQQLA